MFKRLLFTLATAILLLAGSTAQAEGWKAQWNNGTRIESEDGKLKLKFGGRIQADYTFVSADDPLDGGIEDGFEFRRARLFFEGTLYERIKFKAQYDFAGGEAAAKDIWIAIDNHWGELQFGHYKEYFSLEELTSSKYIAFVERSLPVEAFAPSRNSGFGASGESGERFNWGVGAFYDADDFGESVNQDRVNLTGRLGFRPIYEDGGKKVLHLGIAASIKEVEDGGALRFRARPEAHRSSRFVDTGGFAADGATLLGAEIAGVFDRFWFASEYIQADVDAPGAGDPTLGGFYAQAGFFLTPGDYRRFKASEGAFDRNKPKSLFGKDGGSGAWEIAARYSTIDLNDAGLHGGEQSDFTLALNWYPNPATRLMINYVNADVDQVGKANIILVRWQVDF